MPQEVTIIMATYNRAHFIVESLKSIQNQTFTNWECLIVDDGSTDDTKEVIKPILNEDSRIKYYKRPHKYKKGLPGSRNYGLDLASGKYIIFFDDDDIVHPQNLELCVKELSNEEVSFCRYLRDVFIGHFNYNFDNSKKYNSFYIDENDIEKIVNNVMPFNSCAVMWKKECFTNHRFVEDLMYAEEWELYSRIISSGYKGISIGKTLFFGRKHDNSNTGEFWRNSKIRVDSKKTAIQLVLHNLYKKKILTPYLFKYLVNLAISFRDFKLVKNLLKVTNPKLSTKLFYKIKYYLFPFWVFYKKILKHKN
jgi:glycosyltransferase involved in cell wall biosynthesis